MYRLPGEPTVTLRKGGRRQTVRQHGCHDAKKSSGEIQRGVPSDVTESGGPNPSPLGPPSPLLPSASTLPCSPATKSVGVDEIQRTWHKWQTNKWCWQNQVDMAFFLWQLGKWVNFFGRGETKECLFPCGGEEVEY